MENKIYNSEEKNIAIELLQFIDYGCPYCDNLEIVKDFLNWKQALCSSLYNDKKVYSYEEEAQDKDTETSYFCNYCKGTFILLAKGVLNSRYRKDIIVEPHPWFTRKTNNSALG